MTAKSPEPEAATLDTIEAELMDVHKTVRRQSRGRIAGAVVLFVIVALLALIARQQVQLNQQGHDIKHTLQIVRQVTGPEAQRRGAANVDRLLLCTHAYADNAASHGATPIPTGCP